MEPLLPIHIYGLIELVFGIIKIGLVVAVFGIMAFTTASSNSEDTLGQGIRNDKQIARNDVASIFIAISWRSSSSSESRQSQTCLFEKRKPADDLRGPARNSWDRHAGSIFILALLNGAAVPWQSVVVPVQLPRTRGISTTSQGRMRNVPAPVIAANGAGLKGDVLIGFFVLFCHHLQQHGPLCCLKGAVWHDDRSLDTNARGGPTG